MTEEHLTIRILCEYCDHGACDLCSGGGCGCSCREMKK
jgi:hypothetical protein